MSEQKKRHRIFDVATQKSNNLGRRISVFRTPSGQRIDIYFYPRLEDPCLTIGITRGTEELFLDEVYYLFLKSGECMVATHGDILSSTGIIRHNFQKNEKYSAEDAIGSERWPSWLRMQLDTLVQWLEDPNTVRVNPYHPEIILIGEEEDIDRYFGSLTKKLDNYRINLALTPIEPGIVVVRESTIFPD